MKPRVAIVFCVHHKPWLIMSTLVSVLAQDFKEVDFFVVYNVDDGTCREKESYQEYFRLLAQCKLVNPQLSSYDLRVREVSRISHRHVYEHEFQNDHALDSGVWYKFIKSGMWQPYDYVLFMGEGALLTRTHALSSMLRFAASRNAHFIASGHEKRRLPKELFLRYNTRGDNPTDMDYFHDRMIRATFELFCRDPAFARLLDRWSSDFPGETQNHVPDIWGGSLWDRIWNAANESDAQSGNWVKSGAKSLLQRYRHAVLALDSSLVPRWGGGSLNGHSVTIHVNGIRRKLNDVIPSFAEEDGVKFHQVTEPEWFGCTVIHVLSRQFLQRLAEKLESFSMYEALEIPFAGTALEVIWGFLPIWLGFDKWFTDGFHRVRKNFATYRREDDAEGMAGYMNRYYRNQLLVRAEGDYIKIKKMSKELGHLRAELNDYYF